MEPLRDVERAKEFLRHKFPVTRLENVFAEALAVLLERIDPERRLKRLAARARGRKAAGGDAGRPASAGRGRAIPRWVKDRVWRRDGGR